jgi:recombination protein RecA
MGSGSGMHAISGMQREGAVAVFVDAEHSLDPKYAQALGVDLKLVPKLSPDDFIHSLWRDSEE